MFECVAKGKFTDGGLIIASALPIVSSDSLVFSAKGKSMDAGANKGILICSILPRRSSSQLPIITGALYARIKVSGCVDSQPSDFLDVFNCHLQATHSDSQHTYSQVETHPLKHRTSWHSTSFHLSALTSIPIYQSHLIHSICMCPHTRYFIGETCTAARAEVIHRSKVMERDPSIGV